MRPPQTAPTPFADAVLVCGKCLRKAHAKHFRKVLKRALKGDDKRSRILVIETSCLDLCPKRRIVLAGPQDLVAGRVIIADPDDAATLATLLKARRTAAANAQATTTSPIDSAERQP